MIADKLVTAYLGTADAWIFDGCSLNVSYLALATTKGQMRLLRLSIVVGPVPVNESYAFSVETDRIVAGNLLKNNATKAEIFEFLKSAIHGEVWIDGRVYSFASSNITYDTELNDTLRWAYDLHLCVNAPITEGCNYDVPSIDRELRTIDTPFDGLQDLVYWLGLAHTTTPTNLGRAELRVKPPVDCVIDQTSLRDDLLTLNLLAHPKFDSDALHVAVRGVPGVAIAGRRQVAKEISWKQLSETVNEGSATIKLENSDSALVMLSLAGNTIRRQWFVDPVKARNIRAFATKHFDPEMKQLRRALLDEKEKDSTKFETAVAALFFLMGCASAVQLETQAPDLLVSTPAGRLVLVECTLRVADFSTKLGKLVDRRISLTNELARTGHAAQVYSILVCRVPLEQIAVDTKELVHHNVILLTQQNLQQAVDLLHSHFDPDSFLDEQSGIKNPSNSS